MGGMRLGLSAASLLALLVTPIAAGCNRPSSDNIQLWKTTQKGPERLHETLVDRGVAPRLRGEAAVALIDIGHTEEVEETFAKLPTDDRAEIWKTVEPAYVKRLGEIPSREALLGMFAGALNSILYQVVGALEALRTERDQQAAS